MSIPKIVHIIWVGGKSPITSATGLKSNLARIINWKEKLTGWEVILWTETERALTGPAFNTLIENKIKVQDISSVLKDFEEPWSQFVHDELFGSQANFGAASDILRVAILVKFGGLYTDLDNFPGTNINSMNTLASSQDLYVGLYENPAVFCNAVLAAKKGSQFMKDYMAEIVNEYRRMYSPSLADIESMPILSPLKEKIKESYNSFKKVGNEKYTNRLLDALTNFNIIYHRKIDRLNTTINMTGPRILRWCIERHFFNYSDDYVEYIKSYKDYEVFTTQANKLKDNYIPIDVIKITSENSWGGKDNLDLLIDQANKDLEKLVDNITSDWLNDVD
ncbi:TcdA/TcdB catalytic glycosyltransferase domain-containing protein [Vibrio gazogenes]|uniref:Glycosyltransferase sugar-binding region containing DXD motif-containing protein n=1 Tax=Vibrio gazogenes DSM 21264 = NBRC 103151 TaxID=1123492 RepID=A0A1M5EMY1_VIBGA|nr:TcdA/TcdB catalytic glycosyltransferase domain-containing protein [Vibrio gazogenes]USP12572.1 hypothetical protein MKS89_08890 [Vibrio gazogenes]SHF80589.1 Glycosyltransferase sugar-binding region containing DXD motif-containing protein [Vibrio gazogenes DSM 21264] [Vibrio gazogenes DSM 21264 = NBRC 103151]SJN54077.1 Subversion of eukaryotic traffic protein A [Vibrio gazogenes]